MAASSGRECGAEMSQGEAAELYQRALSEAAEIASESVSQGFEESRRKTMWEFETFLTRLGQGISIENARDLDVIAFVQGWWIPAHKEKCRTRASDGKKVVSASAVKGIVQHIAKSYSMVGRRDNENPAKQESVRSYSDDYRNRLHSRGVREKRAKVFREGKVEELIAHLRNRIGGSAGIQRCLLKMDLTAVLYLWESWCRGKECGELEGRQVNFQEGVALPGWSKTEHQEPSARIELSGGGRGRFVESAVDMIRDCESQGHHIGKGFLFRPLNRQRDGFEQTPLQAAALRKRVQQHSKDAGLFEGETLHSFRRSAVQNAAQMEGYNVEKLMQLGRWKSYAAFRLYIEEIEADFSGKIM
jgi:integrase